MFKTIKKDFNEMYATIKSPEVEEVFDIYFSRFFGYYLALLGKKLTLTANQVSVASLLIGIVAGVFFYFQDQMGLVMIGCVLITLAGLLDSADGQLARMTGTSSELGRKIDVIIDTFVFVAAYTGGALYFFPQYGFWIIILAAMAGWLHSVKSSMYEFYKTEFLYYKYRSRDLRIPFPEEVQPDDSLKPIWRKTLLALEKDYIGKQAFFHGRKKAHRLQFEKWSHGEQQHFFEQYRQHHHRLLTWWALVGGTNVHRTALMIFSLFGRMDMYFFFSIITFLPMFWIRAVQQRTDQKTISSFHHSSQITH